MPVFIPWPPTGLWTCAASPSRKARLSRKRGATRWWTRYVENQFTFDARKLHPIHRPALDVVERDRVIGLLASVHEAHQTQVARTLQREDEEEVGVLDVDVQLVVDERAACVNVGDVEVPLIRAAREFDAELVSDGRRRAVAAGDVRRLEQFLAGFRAERRASRRRRFCSRWTSSVSRSTRMPARSRWSMSIRSCASCG